LGRWRDGEIRLIIETSIDGDPPIFADRQVSFYAFALLICYYLWLFSFYMKKRLEDLFLGFEFLDFFLIVF
jgi:hypothetical protein